MFKTYLTYLKASAIIALLLFFSAEATNAITKVQPVRERPAPEAPFNSDTRLIHQLPDLTTEQRNQLHTLMVERRAEISHLHSLYQNDRIDQQTFRTRSKELLEAHQSKVKDILSEEQWTALEELRTSQRTANRAGFQAYHLTRMELAAEELGLDSNTQSDLAEIIKQHQHKRSEARSNLSEPRRMARMNSETRKEMLMLQLSMQDEIRALLGDEKYIEWRALVSSHSRHGNNRMYNNNRLTRPPADRSFRNSSSNRPGSRRF
ncbi:hypothetical protein QLX67_11970 [Balneolaceae bacterium ANBcel3]|nr:hypothetical protein [Balneolaceae bacterium ANBcel3]